MQFRTDMADERRDLYKKANKMLLFRKHLLLLKRKYQKNGLCHRFIQT